MPLRRQTRFTREGWYYALVFAMVFGAALVNEVNLLMVLAGMLAGPLLISRFVAFQMLRGLVVRRRLPQGVCAGDLLLANVTVANPRSRLGSWALVVEDQVARTGAVSQVRDSEAAGPRGCPEVFFPYVPAGQTSKGAYRGRLARRGRYRIGPLRLATRFPFGLLLNRITLGSTAVLTVLPRLGRLTQRWMARHHESFAGTERREQRPGSEGDFYGLRPWQRGDSRRWIHWRTTARRGTLMVRQFEQPRNRDLAVLVDLWQPAAGQEHAEAVEAAVSFAATIIAELCRKGGSDVYLGLSDPAPRLVGGPASAVLLQDLMERLAVVEAQPGDPLAQLLAEALRQVGPGTEIVLIATRPVDWSDAARFGQLAADPVRRAALGRIRTVDASGPELATYFQPE
ncbi:MAG: DUF58 domain-containing protein [Thermoguttaceae bacterium]|jgi:uncharacterized protein (DUF58 family)